MSIDVFWLIFTAFALTAAIAGICYAIGSQSPAIGQCERLDWIGLDCDAAQTGQKGR